MSYRNTCLMAPEDSSIYLTILGFLFTPLLLILTAAAILVL